MERKRRLLRVPIILMTIGGLLVSCADEGQASNGQGLCGRPALAWEDGKPIHDEHVRATLQAISRGEVDNIDTPEELERASQTLALFIVYPHADGSYDAFGGNATVFMNSDGRLMLVTAYHVLTGKGRYDPNSTDFVIGLANAMTSNPEVIVEGRFVKVGGDAESDLAVVGLNYSESAADLFADWAEAKVNWLGSLPNRVFGVVRQPAYENANGGKAVVLRGDVVCRSDKGRLKVNFSGEDGESGAGFGPEGSSVITHILLSGAIYKEGDEWTTLAPISLARKHLDAVAEALSGAEKFSR